MKRNNPNQLQICHTAMYRMNGGFAVSAGTGIGTDSQRRIGSNLT